jgi:hypothetical protein
MERDGGVRLIAFAAVLKMTALSLQINAFERVTIEAKQRTIGPT